MSRIPLTGLDYNTFYPAAKEKEGETYPRFQTETEIKEHEVFLRDSHQLAEDLFTVADTALSVAEIAGYRTEESTPVVVFTGANGDSDVRTKAFTFGVDTQGVTIVRFYPYGDERYLIIGYDKDGNPTRMKTQKDPHRLALPKDPTERGNLLRAVKDTMDGVHNTLIDPTLPLDKKTELFDGISIYNGPVIGEPALAKTSRLVREAMEKATTQEEVVRLITLHRARAKESALRNLPFLDPVPSRESRGNIAGTEIFYAGIRAAWATIPVVLCEAINREFGGEFNLSDKYLGLYIGFFSFLLAISNIQNFVRDGDTQSEVEKVIASE